MPMFGAAQKKKPQRASTVSALDLLGWAERVGTIRVWQMADTITLKWISIETLP